LNLAVESRGAALHQRNIRRKTHAVHMPARIQIIQRIEDEIERLEPCDIEPLILDIIMVRLDLDVRVEPARRLFRNLVASHISCCSSTWGFQTTHQRLRLLDMLVAEQKLAIQITQIDRVQVDNMDFAKAREHQVLEQFAADAASADHQDARLHVSVVSKYVCARVGGSVGTCLMRACRAPKLRWAKESRTIASAEWV
jgi:hypothetical protein